MDETPQSDRLLDFAHPRETADFVGNAPAEHKLLRAWLSGKMHHAWIIGGPRGIGKATLAHRLARFVLRHKDPAALDPAPSSLFVPPDDPVFRRVAAGSHPDMFVARREYDQKAKRMKRDISADTVRRVTRFFGRTSGEGGWRVCIVDAADDLNRSAANALLKALEEPPARCLFLLVAHAPMRLMPTIRSRCIRLDLHPLEPDELATLVRRHLPADMSMPGPHDHDFHTLTQGSAGQALSLLSGGGWELFGRFRDLVGKDRPTSSADTLAFAEALAARGAEDDYAAFCRMALDWIAACTRRAAACGGPAVAERAMADAWQQIAHSIDRANALNLDRKQTVLHALQLIEDSGARHILRG